MKNKTYWVLGLSIVVLILIILSSFRIEKKEITGDNLNFQINRSGRCETNKFYKMDNYDIYFYCLDEVFVSDEETKVTLKEYLDSNKEEAINNIIRNLSHEWAMYDGGTEKFSNETISLIKCKKMGMKEDVYIGIPDMDLEDDYCINEVR